MDKYRGLFIFSILVLLFSATAYAAEEDHVIINSKDWRDVYSGFLYAKLNGIKSNFVGSVSHSRVVLNMVSKSSDILIVSSRDTPFVGGYQATVGGLGYTVEDEIISRNSNLELAERLEGISNFIVLDDDYGYNAISVASYAVASKSYVLFANEDNINDITDFLDSVNVNSIIVYGNVDALVKEGLQRFDPETINEGDRFDNNLKIVDRYLLLKPDTKQVFLTNGEFIEDSLMSGLDPVMFIGKVNVPDQVREYIKKSQFQVATLIGNELIGVAQFIKNQIGIPVFVKFAQGARTPSGGISQVEDLDRFAMPRYDLLLGIYEIRYNQATNNLEITFENQVDLGAYFLPTITLTSGEEEKVLGVNDCTGSDDGGAIFIDKGAYKTIVCQVQFEGEATDLSAEIYVLYGESGKSLENVLEGKFDVSTVRIMDESSIELVSLVYDKGANEFILEVVNNGDVDVFVSPEISDLFINDEYLDFGIAQPEYLKKGESKKIRIEVDPLTDEDIEENSIIRVKAYYGQRETSLFKITFSEFAFEIKKANYYIYIIIIVLVLLFLLLGFSRKKCPNCKHKNSRTARRCVKCHHRF